MSYIIKKKEPLVNLKLTNTGRSNLSSGKLTLTNFSLGDSEMDYSSDTFSLVNILRPVDSQHDIQYPVPSEGSSYKLPISIFTSLPNEVYGAAKERGFFSYDDNINIDTTLCLLGGATGTTATGTTTLDLVFNDNTFINDNYSNTVKKGDYLFIKFKTSGYTETYSGTTLNYNELNVEPIPYLMYSIISINSAESFDLTGYTTGVTISVEVDRELPLFSDYTFDAFVYPGKDTIKDYYDVTNPNSYWDGGLLDFTSNSTMANDDIPVWNMNIVTIEDIIGLDSTVNKGKYSSKSRNYWGTTVCYDYFLDNLLNKVGIIHYTNNSVSNLYAEGFYRDTFKLKLPYIMWHKQQYGGAGLGTGIGYTFVCGSTVKYMGTNASVKYYDLVDQEATPTIVGKVLVDQKIILIEHQELLTVLSYKSNRNWTLPKPKLTLTEPGVCQGSSVTGVLQNNEAIHVSYVFNDSEGISGLHCEDYNTISNTSSTVKDIIFEFPKDPLDPTYSEFSFLRDYDDTPGIGFRTDNILLLWQITQINNKPDPDDWNYLNINTFIGKNGCQTGTSNLCDSFELYTESSIYPANFSSYKYGLTNTEIGDVIISLNGSILKQASSSDNIGVDGEYWKYPLSVMATPSNTAYIEFDSTLLTNGDTIQFHYLIGDTTTSKTLRQDITVPLTGIPGGNDYNDGIYINGTKVAITLDYQPNNNVVYFFYNGQLISSNNYGVYTTGSTQYRRVELNFTPANGSVLSVFYLDNSGLGSNPANVNYTVSLIENLRVNLDKSLINLSANSKYDVSDFISLPNSTTIDEFSFGDEVFFYGNIETDIKATIYKTLMTCNVLPNKFINTSNPTFNPNQDKVAFTELAIYDEDDDLVAIGKFSEPLTRKYNSDMLIIQATIDF